MFSPSPLPLLRHAQWVTLATVSPLALLVTLVFAPRAAAETTETTTADRTPVSVRNGGFADGTQAWETRARTARVSFDTVAGYRGLSARLRANRSAADFGIWHRPRTVDTTTPMATYTTRAMVRTSRAMTVVVRVRELNSSTTRTVHSRQWVRPGSWVPLAVNTKARLADSSLRVSVAGLRPGRGDTLRIDNVTMTRVLPATAPVQPPATEGDAPAATPYAGTLRAGLSSRIFNTRAFWYRALPATTPEAGNSSAIVSRIRSAAVQANQNDRWRPSYVPASDPSITMATTAYTPGVFLADSTDPVARFDWVNCMNWPSYVGDQGLLGSLAGVRVPREAVPADGSDAEMTVYDVETRQYTDLWNVRKTADGTFRACWGGTIKDAGASNGVFSGPYGATASGLPFMGGLIMPSELRAGEINHVVGIALPVSTINSKVSSPATRTDGRASGTDTISEGQLLRLPASLDLRSLKLSPTAMTIAKAAQEYGLVVWDQGPNITFRAQNPNSLGSNPYPALMGGNPWTLMGDTRNGTQGFPFHKLKVLPMNYAKP